MEDAIYNLFANHQKEDLLLFYFSGHGIKDDNRKLHLSTQRRIPTYFSEVDSLKLLALPHSTQNLPVRKYHES